MKNRMTTHLVVAELCANFRAWVVVALCGLELGKDHIALDDLMVGHHEVESQEPAIIRNQECALS